MRVMLGALAICLATTVAQAAEIKIATFNTESDADTQPAKVGETIKEIDGVDIWALQEVENEAALQTYMDAAKAARGGNWRYVISESGNQDRVGILYRTDVFRQLETVEFHAIRSMPDGSQYGTPSWGLRGALFLRLQHPASGSEFYVGTVHLKCCGGEGVTTRAHQASLLVDWIKDTDVPVILLGDTNIPISPGETADQVTAQAFRSLADDAELTWIQPTNPFETQCDPDFNSMLDQVFRSSNLPVSTSAADILFAEAAYCDKDVLGFSDHRPIVATFEFQ